MYSDFIINAESCGLSLHTHHDLQYVDHNPEESAEGFSQSARGIKDCKQISVSIRRFKFFKERN